MPETPTWARLMAWSGIVLASIIWRVFLSQAFSLPAVRGVWAYATRCQWVLGDYWCIRATPDLRRGDAAVSRIITLYVINLICRIPTIGDDSPRNAWSLFPISLLESLASHFSPLSPVWAFLIGLTRPE